MQVSGQAGRSLIGSLGSLCANHHHHLKALQACANAKTKKGAMPHIDAVHADPISRQRSAFLKNENRFLFRKNEVNGRKGGTLRL